MIQFVGTICLVWLFAEGASVIKFFKELFNISNDSEPKNRILQVLQKLVNCSMCSGFWIGLAIYQNFFMACIISVTSEAFCKVVKKLGNIFTEL
jgi:hypothetical protein